MRRNRLIILFVLFIMIGATFASMGLGQEATEEPVEATPEVTEVPIQGGATGDTMETGTYTVQPGDTLYRIALRFGITADELAALNGITNSRLIYVGQVLQVPGSDEEIADAAETDQPISEATEEPANDTTDMAPGETSTHTVRAGENLYRIALRYNTSVAEIVALNNLSNSNVLYIGQTLLVPGSAGDVAEPVDTVETAPEDTTTDEVATESEEVMVDFEFSYGVTAYSDGQNATQIATMATDLGIGWVNIPVDWSALEPIQGEINLTTLTDLVNTLDSVNTQIMLTVSNAPAWSRSVNDGIIENGPPDDLSVFETFISTLAAEYTGKVDAYQIWEEPNLRRNWRCNLDGGSPGICDTDYLELLRVAYKSIKAADPNALVITAGLAPTRFNDRVNAIDDRIYLETLVAKNVAEISDAIGVHPSGFGNPPDAICCQPADENIKSHYENSSFYFLENLQNYRQILVDGGAGNMPLWVTRFGWGTSEDTSPPGEQNAYFQYVSLGQQAIFDLRAFEIGQEAGYVDVMFLDNLNGCTIGASRAEVCYTSLIGPDSQPRPVYETIKNLDKQPEE